MFNSSTEIFKLFFLWKIICLRFVIMHTFHNDLIEVRGWILLRMKIVFFWYLGKKRRKREVFLSQGHFSDTVCCIITLNSVQGQIKEQRALVQALRGNSFCKSILHKYTIKKQRNGIDLEHVDMSGFVWVNYSELFTYDWRMYPRTGL